MTLKIKFRNKDHLLDFACELDRLILEVYSEMFFLQQYNLIEFKKKVGIKLMGNVWEARKKISIQVDLNTYQTLTDAYVLMLTRRAQKFNPGYVLIAEVFRDLEYKFDSFKQELQPKLNKLRNEIRENAA